jgi:dienelactone hydrolase
MHVMQAQIIGIFSVMIVSAICSLVQAAEKVKFPGSNGEGYMKVDEARAELSIPTISSGKVPAVVVLHGSGGIDGRGAFHIEALNEAGIATLKVYMFEPGMRPKSGTLRSLPFAYGALHYLSNRPEIDKDRIGVMGFSFGAHMTILAATAKSKEELGKGKGFVAHAAFYPVCWGMLRWSKSREKGSDRYTSAPILLLEGEHDDYSESGTCERFIKSVPPPFAAQLTHRFYPGAAHVCAFINLSIFRTLGEC